MTNIKKEFLFDVTFCLTIIETIIFVYVQLQNVYTWWYYLFMVIYLFTIILFLYLEDCIYHSEISDDEKIRRQNRIYINIDYFGDF